MPTVVLSAQLPTIRIGLAQMLRDLGHTVRPSADATDGAVWVVDDPGSAVATNSPGFLDPGGAAVILSDDPLAATRLVGSDLRGWACLPRDSDPEDIDLAVRAVAAGLVVMSAPLAARVVGPHLPRGGEEPIPALTPRELEVLQLVAQGLPNKGIGRTLSISENTAKFHVGSLATKLGAASRAETVAIAARRGLLVL